jgi:Flp pilus assembly protein TadD
LEGDVNNLDLAPLSPRLRFVAALLVALTLHFSVDGPLLAADRPPATAERDVKDPAARQIVSDGLRAFRSGNRGLGITLFKRAEKLAPKEGWVHLLLGKALLQLYDPVSAERELRQARENGMPDELVLPSLFEAMIKRHEENKLLEQFPAPANTANKIVSAQILSGRAMALLSLDRMDEAAASMDQALARVRETTSLLDRAQIALRQNNPSLATKFIDEALRRDPRNGHVMIAKLEDLIRSNNDAATLAFSEKILQQFPGDVQTRASRIDVFLKNNQDAKAKAELEALAARTPRVRMVQYYRAVFLARTKNYDAAWKIVQTFPPNFALARPPFIVQLSEIAIKSGHAEAGATILARALAYAPDQVDLRLRLAAIRLSQNNPHSAVLVLGPLKDSSNPSALDLLGVANLQAGDSGGAVDTLTRASRLRPQDPQITFHLVQALDESGDRPAARELLKKLLANERKFDDLGKARALEYKLR